MTIKVYGFDSYFVKSFFVFNAACYRQDVAIKMVVNLISLK